MPAPTAEPISQEQIDQLRQQRMLKAATSLGHLPENLRQVHQLLSLEPASMRIAAFRRCALRRGASRYAPLLPQQCVCNMTRAL